MAAHIVTGTMGHPQYYSSKRLDHLGLIAGMCDELRIPVLIDRLIPQNGYPLNPGREGVPPSTRARGPRSRGC